MDRTLRHLIQKVGGAVAGSAARNLSLDEAQDAYRYLLEGGGDPVQVGALLVAFRSKGTTGDELLGFSRAARERITFPRISEETVVLSTSRMGKYQHPALGLATVAAAVGAGAKVLIQAAPHARGGGVTIGDMWQKMVGDFCEDASAVEAKLESRGVACWQPTQSDRGWLRLLEVENHLGLRSAPDVIAKSLAPHGARVMVPSRLGPVLGMASDVFCALGHKFGIILQGSEGSLDPSLCKHTRGMWIENGHRSPLRESPEDYGIFCYEEPGHVSSDRYESSQISIRKALTGVAGPEFDCVTLGGALILRLAGIVPDVASGVGMTRESLESGAAERAIFPS